MKEPQMRDPEVIPFWRILFGVIFSIVIIARLVWGDPTQAPPNGPPSIAFTGGKIGIGVVSPSNLLSIGGNMAIGSTYANLTKPANSLTVEGRVSVGTTQLLNKLSVAGNASVGAGYAAIPAPVNSLIIEGALGIGRKIPSAAFAGALELDSGIRVGGIAQVGSWSSRIPALMGSAFTSDPSINFGSFSAMTISPGGDFLIPYYDDITDDLKLNTNAVSGLATQVTFDTAGDVGQYVSIATGSDGYPVMAYYDSAPNQDVKVAKCNDSDCVSVSFVKPDSGGDTGKFSSIAIGTSGFPVLAYQIAINKFKIALCVNLSCSSFSGTQTVTAFSGNLQGNLSLAIAADGNPLVSFADDSGLRTIKYGGSSISIDSGSGVGQYNALTIGSDGFPVISYYSGSTTGLLKVAKCLKSDCSGGSSFITITTVDNSGTSANPVGEYNSITIGNDGNPLISYLASSTASIQLRVLKCGTLSCYPGAGASKTAENSIAILPGLALRGNTSIAIGADGLPFVPYYGVTGNPPATKLLYVKCESDNCISGFTRR